MPATCSARSSTWTRNAIVAALLFANATPSWAQLRVMMSGGFSAAYRQVLPEFERESGITVTTISGASQGSGPETISAQLARGVAADVVILSRQGLRDLTGAGRILAESDVDLAQTPLGLAIRTGATKPDISTVERLKQALLLAHTIAAPGSTGGLYLTNELLPRLELVDRLTVKLTARGSESAALVASGEATFAIQPVSELLHLPGVEFVGVLPPDVQLVQVFAGAVLAGSTNVEKARQLIAFLASNRASAAISNNGMERLRVH